MNLMDVVALAKAGYSVKDVKELIALSKEEPKDEVKEEPKDTPKDDVKEPEEEPKETPKEEPKEVKPDYEKLYNELIKKNKGLSLSTLAVNSIKGKMFSSIFHISPLGPLP